MVLKVLIAVQIRSVAWLHKICTCHRHSVWCAIQRLPLVVHSLDHLVVWDIDYLVYVQLRDGRASSRLWGRFLTIVAYASLNRYVVLRNNLMNRLSPSSMCDITSTSNSESVIIISIYLGKVRYGGELLSLFPTHWHLSSGQPWFCNYIQELHEEKLSYLLFAGQSWAWSLG